MWDEKAGPACLMDKGRMMVRTMLCVILVEWRGAEAGGRGSNNNVLSEAEEEAGIFLVTAVELVEIWWKLDFRYETW